jgi:hypothetical protein
MAGTDHGVQGERVVTSLHGRSQTFTRREFLRRGSAAGAALCAAEWFGSRAPLGAAAGASEAAWDAGSLFHVLPVVSHDRALLKCSLRDALPEAPELMIDGRRIEGRRTDSRGRYWEFEVAALKPGTPYRVELRAQGRALAEPWDISTFPDPESDAAHVRIVFYTCAGGHDALKRDQPIAVRQALLSRALSFSPHAIVANGDHVYWDLFAPGYAERMGASAEAIAHAGRFDRSRPIFGTPNEEFLLKAAGEQIAPLYRTMCRSTPVFFVQDDHDYFDNDVAAEGIVTFPPTDAMLRLARATQKLLYPEFLPDPYRPLGLAGTREDEGRAHLSSNYGTLRYGKLLEVLLYDNRRTGTMHGPSAVFVDSDVESWLTARMQDRAVTHVVNAPGLPPGWTKGNWYEWYPDVFADGRASVARAKPYWQPGWLAQHDRIVTAAHRMQGRVPLIVSGDIHATAFGQVMRSGSADMSRNPVVTVVPGTLGTMTGFPSDSRGIGVQHPNHLDMVDAWTPIEENGFTVADFYRDRIELAFFVWSHERQRVSDIRSLEPRHRVALQPVS